MPDDLVNLTTGHPLPDALPVESWAAAGVAAAREYGAQLLDYGNGAGPAPLVEWLCDRLSQTDTRAPAPGEVFVAGGASHGLDLACAALVRSGDTVLVDAPTYFLAFQIFADYTTDIRPVPTDGDGIDPDATDALISSLHAAGQRVALLYLVPTFSNPTGQSLAGERRAALVAVARRHGVVVLEDDTYRELAYDAPAPPSLWSLAESGEVVRVGSFAKTVAPGLRLGWLTAPPSLVDTFAARGYIRSGGGVNHATALTMAQFCTSGAYLDHLGTIVARYREQRDLLVGAVRRELPGVAFTPPGGGWFVWLALPDGGDAVELLPSAEAAGVSYLPGPRCFVDNSGERYLRLSFSLLPPDRMAEGVRRLATVLEGRSPY
jgi:DNA-binding transcriptional MocR family regulator